MTNAPYKTLFDESLASSHDPRMRAPREGFYIDRFGDEPRICRLADTPGHLGPEESAQWSHRQLLVQGGKLQMERETEWWGYEVTILAHHLPIQTLGAAPVAPEFPPPPGTWLLRDGQAPQKLDMTSLITHGRAKLAAGTLRGMEVEQAFLRAGKLQAKEDREWMVLTVDVIWHSKTDVGKKG